MSSYRTDLPFAPVPVWVIDLPISDRALRLYALLAGMRDYDTDQASYGRKLLAKKLRCSQDSLDRAKAELVEHGGISVEQGEAVGGAIPRNVYTVHRIPPDSRTRAATEDDPIAAPVRPPDSRTRAAMNKSTSLDEKSSSPKRKGFAPTSLSGVKVTPAEEAFGIEVLEIFNEVATAKTPDRTFRFFAKGFIGKVILRHREHPELDAAAHRTLIEQQFDAPWWKGDPSPSVIYGSGESFDRAVNGVRGAKVDPVRQAELDELAEYTRA